MKKAKRKLLRSTHTSLLAAARQNFERSGCCPPILIFNLRGQRSIVALDHQGPDSKSSTVALIRELIARGACEYVLVLECWFADAATSTTWRQEHSSLADFPGRKELVLFLYASPEEEFLLVADISRAEGKAVLGPWQPLGVDASETLLGRFQGLYRKAKVRDN